MDFCENVLMYMFNVFVSAFHMSEPFKLAVDVDSVNVTEGKNMKIACKYSGKALSPAIASWSKPGSTNFNKRPVVLEMSNIQREQAGDYKCEYGEYNRILTIYILCKCISVISTSNIL